MDNPTSNFKDSVLFHGTSIENAKVILRDGFRVWVNDPEFGPAPSGGNLGNGLYFSSRWATALAFGRALFQVRLTPGTRILDATIPPDSKTIKYLKKEFGKEILEQPSWKVVPHNKRLTGREMVELFRYQYRRVWGSVDKEKVRWFNQVKLLRKFRSILIRHGYHAYGDPQDENGVVVFAEDRIVLEAFVGVNPDAYYCNFTYFDKKPYQNLAAFRRAALDIEGSASATS